MAETVYVQGMRDCMVSVSWFQLVQKLFFT